MIKNFANRTKENTTSTDTSVLVLTGAVNSSWRAFIDKLAAGTPGIEVEVGPDVAGNWIIGTYTLTDAGHLTRTSLDDYSPGAASGVLAAGTKEVTNIISANRLASVFSTAEAVTLNALPSAAPTGPNLIPFSNDGGSTLSYCSISSLLALGGAAPTETISVTTPSAKTTGNAFTLAGGYTNGTPTALDYSLDGGSTWQAAISPVIGSGAYSFSVTLSTANAAQVINVRDHNNISVIGATSSFAVTGAAVQALTVSTPTAQTIGVAFTVSGTYVNGTPGNLDSSIDGGTSWQAVAAPTIAGGNYSFSLSIGTANASQTIKVRDRATLVSGTSGTFAVAAPAQTLTVNTPAGQTAGTAFTVTGSYTNGTPTGLAYSTNGGTSWTAATSPTIGSGNYSFSLSIATANAAQVLKVRDSTTLTTGTSGTFAVAAGPAVPDAPTINAATAYVTTTDVIVPVVAAGSGPAATGFVVKVYKTSDNSLVVTSNTAGAAGNITVTAAALVSGTSYYAKAEASNGLGASAQSAPLTFVWRAGITGYSGNAVKTTFNAASGLTTYNGKKQIPSGSTGTNASYPSYYVVSPEPASAKGGWGTSATVPPAEITTAENVSPTVANGMVPITHTAGSTTFNIGSINLWATVGSGDGGFAVGAFLWFKTSDGLPFCFNPAAPMVISGA